MSDARHIPSAHQPLMAAASEPRFDQELAAVWGEPWGASDEVGQLRRVLVRAPGDELKRIAADAWDEEVGALVDAEGGWYWTDRHPPDLDLVARQHGGLVAALRAEGVEVIVAEPLGGSFVKSMYVRDPLVTVPGGAIIGRMGVRMRRGEEAAMTKLVAAIGMPILATITGSGTLEGGSFTKLRPGLAALGLSLRCNRSAAEQLEEVLARIGWNLLLVPLSGYSIHLDLHLAMVDRDRALVDVEHLPYWFLEELRRASIEITPSDPDEPWALNAVCVRPGRVIMADGSPRTTQRLLDAGIEVITLGYDEIHKNGGGVHCSTIELIREPAST